MVPAREALADIVVGVAEDLELEATHGEGAQRLAGRAPEPDRDVAGLQRVHAIAAGDVGREPRADRAMHVPHIVLELHLLAVDQHRPGVLDHLRVKGVRHLVPALERAVPGQAARVDLRQDRIEVEVVEIGAAAAHLLEEIGPADRLVERAQAERGQDLAHLLGDEAHQVDDLLGRARELLPQIVALGADPDRAGVGVALPDHDAAHGHERGRADAVLLGPQQRRDDDVAARS